MKTRVFARIVNYPEKLQKYQSWDGAWNFIDLDDVEEWILKHDAQACVDLVGSLKAKSYCQHLALELADFAIDNHHKSEYIDQLLVYSYPDFWHFRYVPEEVKAPQPY